MRNSLLTAAVAVAGLLYAGTASASAWTPPDNVRIVQKSGSGTNVLISSGAIDTRIQEAIDDVTGCTPEAHCTVKVMPGQYDLGTAFLQMRDYVDLVGSGPDATEIRSSVSTVATECDRGTVMMANDGTISDVRIVNITPPAAAHVVGIAFSGLHDPARATRVQVYAGDDTAPSSRGIAVCAEGPTTFALLDTVDIEGHGGRTEGERGAGQGNAIRMADGAALKVTNSRLAAFAAENNVNVINDAGASATSTTIDDCSIEGTSPSAHAFWTGTAKTVVRNSRITMDSPDNVYLYQVDAPDENAPDASFTVINTTIDIESGTPSYDNAGVMRIANSQLPGSRVGLAGATLVNNYDGSFAPIANQ